MRALRAIAAAALALVPAVSQAAGDEEHGASLAWHALNLALLLGVLVYFVRAPLHAFLTERRQRIEAGIESARAELASAEQRLADWQKRANTLDRELDEIRSSVREQAERERDRLLVEARESAERIRRDAAAAADQEMRRAREQLRGEAVDLAVQLAGDLLRAQVGDADRMRLVDDFVRRVEQASDSRS